jgi:type IV fimbrial biogenesis protein FimT
MGNLAGREGLGMSRGKAGGFTLVEMMVALLVLAVLIVISAPGFTNLIKNNRMLSHMYAMRAALNGARSEALAQRAPVTLCRIKLTPDGPTCDDTAGDWNIGFMAFLDDNGNGVDDPNDQIFISKVIEEDSLTVTYSGGFKGGNAVQFDSRGYASKSSQGTFTVCDDRDKARGVKVTAGGMVVALDPNDPALACP